MDGFLNFSGTKKAGAGLLFKPWGEAGSARDPPCRGRGYPGGREGGGPGGPKGRGKKTRGGRPPLLKRSLAWTQAAFYTESWGGMSTAMKSNRESEKVRTKLRFSVSGTIYSYLEACLTVGKKQDFGERKEGGYALVF